jgi:hypothetical protein
MKGKANHREERRGTEITEFLREESERCESNPVVRAGEAANMTQKKNEAAEHVFP